MVSAQASSPAWVEEQVCFVDVERDALRELGGSAGRVGLPERLACFVVLAVPREPVLPRVLPGAPPALAEPQVPQASLLEPVLPQDGFQAQVLLRLRVLLQVPQAEPQEQAVPRVLPAEPPERAGSPEQQRQADC